VLPTKAERHGPERQGPERQGPERQGPERQGPERQGPERRAPERRGRSPEVGTTLGTLLPGELARPPGGPCRTPRAAEIVGAARRLLDNDGPEAVTMRRVADELGIQAPSLYKHFPNKAALEMALIEDALVEMGEVSHRTIQLAAPERRLGALLDAYRSYSLSHPHLYRLATSGPLARDGLSPGLEEWAGNPWYVVTGDAYLAQALWSFAHGMVVLELDDRYLPGSDLSRTWSAGACAFQHTAALGRARLRGYSLQDEQG
jgi:AcrR family transcriptional regulator